MTEKLNLHVGAGFREIISRLLRKQSISNNFGQMLTDKTCPYKDNFPSRVVLQFFEKHNVYAVVGTQHAVSLRIKNPHEIYIS